MSKSNFSEEFKRDAARQVTERGYPVAEVSQRLGVSRHSHYEWRKKFAASNSKGNDEGEEVSRLKKELARVTEERDILKKRSRISPGMQSEVRVHCPAPLAVLGADDVPHFAGSSQWILHLAEEPAERAGQRGQATDLSWLEP
ncbi:transposase-like protein [Rhizobium sp. 1399]|nr:transposase-like protein [Rhizobium sp. 1399]